MRKIKYIVLMLAFPMLATANDYPTLERVDYVLTCMKKHGGQTVDNLYACSCAVDALAQNMDFDTYVEASTFASYKRMPGERGGLFRDNEHGEGLAAKLKAAEQDAEKRCFIGVKRKQAKK